MVTYNTFVRLKCNYLFIIVYISFKIGMIAIGQDGHVAAGTSTNGANHKIPGYIKIYISYIIYESHGDWMAFTTVNQIPCYGYC